METTSTPEEGVWSETLMARYARYKGKNQATTELMKVQFELWRRGEVDWLLRDYQLEMKKDILASKSLKYMLNSSRRLGKTTVLIMIAVEMALARECHIQFTTSTQGNMRKILRPILEKMCKTAPTDIKPQFKGQDQCYWFPSTDSYLYLAGSNNGHEDDSRGTFRDACIIDEGQNIDRLEYLIGSVLLPQTIDRPGGRLIVAGTPPETVDHYYKELHDELELTDDVLTKDVYVNNTIPKEKLEKYKREAGGENSTTWKREYLCKFVNDTKRAVVNVEHLKVYNSEVKVGYYTPHVSMDVGGSHLTAVLFSYWDWDKAILVIQKEWVCGQNTVTSDVIADEVRKAMKELNYDEDKANMVSDNNNIILLQDLYNEHGLAFYPTAKDNLQAQINKVKRWMKEGKIVIHEDCVQLIGCIKGATWNLARTKFTQSKKFGHWDALSALVYLVRNVDESEDPPREVLDPNKYQFIEPEEKHVHPLARVFGRRF